MGRNIIVDTLFANTVITPDKGMSWPEAIVVIVALLVFAFAGWRATRK